MLFCGDRCCGGCVALPPSKTWFSNICQPPSSLLIDESLRESFTLLLVVEATDLTSSLPGPTPSAHTLTTLSKPNNVSQQLYTHTNTQARRRRHASQQSILSGARQPWRLRACTAVRACIILHYLFVACVCVDRLGRGGGAPTLSRRVEHFPYFCSSA